MASKGKKKKVSKNDEGPGLRAANKPEYTTGTGQQMWRVHSKELCQGRICDIHNPPTEGPTAGWRTHWRADRALMEVICPLHGVGHPSAAHMAYLREQDEKNGTDNARWEGIHGCCGCCFSLDKEFETYFDSDFTEVHDYWNGPEWVDHDAPANGIGPACISCHNLIDSHPQDHKLGCPWL